MPAHERCDQGNERVTNVDEVLRVKKEGIRLGVGPDEEKVVE
jgi:hypothetical protein